ncbi:triose-phosphate isomerase [Sulfoacidibacillus ferrooxidans]|uniref:triose-phosphate isomerase n=1 Tax=Sulfoacidibacillus ferrooxidans TaxID=2005001 RepID=UPI001F50BC41
MRKKLVAGNWKMYKTLHEADAFAQELVEYRDMLSPSSVDALICAPFTALCGLGEKLKQVHVKLGAQHMHEAEQGAWTGEISAAMLQDLGCEYVILGHSERRQFFAESDEAVAKKTCVALDASMVPIVCVGESLSEREAGATQTVVSRQLGIVLEMLQLQKAKGALDGAFVIAYEPVWAIGSGKSSSAQDAQDVATLIRSLVTATLGQRAGEQVRIVYGGSVKPDNIQTYVQQPDIDGALIGGASLQVASFVALVEQVAALS